jgi:CHAT domain-containing protein/tetratricopeptide (TPR) repeat protein
MKSRSQRLGHMIVLFALIVFTSSPHGASDPKQLQDQAIKRIDLFVEHFRKTGDFKTRVAELLAPAQNELVSSHQGFNAVGDLSGAALSLIKLGAIQRALSQWQAALEVYQEAVKTARAAKHTAHHADALTGLAMTEDNSRNSASALVHIAEAIELAGSVSDKKYLFEALSVKGEVLTRQGNLAAAADSLNRALELAPQVTEEKLFYPYLDRGDVYQKLADQCDFQKDISVCQEQYELARADYERAGAVAQKRGWTGLQKLTDSFVSSLATKQAMLQSQGRMGEMVKQSGLFHPKRAGDVLVSEQFAIVNPDVAETLTPIYEEAQRYERLAGGFADISAARIAHTDGLMRQARGDLDGALPAFLKAVDLVEKDRGKLSDERTRGKFLEDKISFYHAPALVYLEKKRPDEAFSLLERSKSRAMADLLASRALTLAGAEERGLYAATVELKAKIAKQQDEQFKLIASAGKKDKLTAKGAEIQMLEGQYRTLLGRLAIAAPKAQELIVAPSATLDQLQQAMRVERFEVLQFLVQDTGVIVWHVNADSVQVRSIFLPRRELIDKIGVMQSSLSDRNAKFDDVVAKELFLFLVQPALPWIESERLVIIPHDELHGLSFQALLNPADGRFLGERFQLSYAPSATVLLSLKRAASIAKGNLLAIADPDIEAAPKEVAAIAALYSKRSKVIAETLAREAEVKTLVAGYDVVHLSVHGKFDASEPLFSYLNFSAGEQDDGKLTAAEMFGLPLQKTHLVVLSACETGKAEVTRGDEVIGLTRALLYAGAGSLVLSHWEVDSESTALWMQTFYREAQLKPLAEAARLALRAVKSNPDFSHPYYWAAFTLITR